MGGNVEFAGRYAQMGKWLASKKGIAVYSHDHLAHGKTAEKEGLQKGDTSHPFLQLPVDVAARCKSVLREAKDKWGSTNSSTNSPPRLRMFLYGHSVGSVIAQLACLHDGGSLGRELSGLCLSGPVFRPTPFLGWFLKTAARAAALVLGKTGHSETFERLLVFNEYQKDFAPNKTRYDWLTRQTAPIEAFVESGAGHTASMRYWISFAEQLSQIGNHDYSSLGADLPVLVQLGSEDPLARKPIFPGPKWSVLEGISKELKAQTNVRFTIYKGFRHEPQNDPEIQFQYFQDVADFVTQARRGFCGDRPVPKL